MEIAFITTVSLVWLIYTFLFGDIDKLVIDTVNRLKFALSINVAGDKVGAVNLTLLQAHGQMGIPEIISYGKQMAASDKRGSGLIELFAKKYSSIESFKRTLFWNLFALTAHAVIYGVFCSSTLFLLQLHIIASLALAAIFYWYSYKELSSLAFSEIKFPDKARDASPGGGKM